VDGDTGITGDTGTQGIQGVDGDTGTAGVDGDTGVQGDTGTFANPLTTEIGLGENAGFSLDNALSADGKYSGITIAGTAGATLAFGDLCYFDPTDSRWELTDANAVAAADGDARGTLGLCVLAAAGDASATKMLLWGVISADTAFPSLTINAQVYVSETAGDITNTQPTTTDVVIRVIGVGLKTTDLFFNPSPDFLTHT
jgi:hypothetical protein